MPRNTKDNTFYLTNYDNCGEFNYLYNPGQQTKGNISINAIVQKLILPSRKTTE